MSLDGKSIAIFIAPQGTEEREFAQPKAALEQAGAKVTVIGLEPGNARAVNHDLEPGGSHPVDIIAKDARADDFDGLVIPGGCVGADKLRGDAAIVDFVRTMGTGGKPIGVICHGPWLLVEAGIADGRTLTSFPTLRTDIENAGGTWVDREVVVDDGIVTSRNPKDLPAFCTKIVEEFAEGRHTRADA